MMVALLALFVAMGGVGYAAATIGSAQIKNGSIRGKDIHNSTITGGKVKSDSLTGADVKESTLTKVPTAGTADRAGVAGTAGTAGTANSVNTVRPFGPVTVAEGATATLATHGPLTLVATCAPNTTTPANTDAKVDLRSTVAALGAGDGNSGAITPGVPLVIKDPGASDAPAGGPSTSSGFDDQFFASVPGSSTFSGTVNTTADATANSCTASGYVVIVK